MKNGSSILQIVPRLPPSICGVGDYALFLATSLKDLFAVECTFLVADTKTVDATSKQLGEKVFQFDTRQLLRLEDSAKVLIVQFSSYGYAKSGLPFGLIRELSKVRTPIIVMFHEVYASGRLCSKAFWAGLLMKSLSKRLSRLATYCFANLESSREVIGSNAEVLPVFSNFGEAGVFVPFEKRPNRAVVFAGQVENPSFRQFVSRCLRDFGIEEIVILGNFNSEFPEGKKCIVTGFVTSKEASAWLETCRFGFVDYPPKYLCKSGLFASLAAHGVCPIFDQATELQGGLEWGSNILESKHRSVTFEAIGASLWSWYQGHNLQATASRYADAISRISAR